jgi:hypothetical protein
MVAMEVMKRVRSGYILKIEPVFADWLDVRESQRHLEDFGLKKVER